MGYNTLQSSEEVETKESLAHLAASSIEKEGYEGLEKYTQSLSSVESLLTFDRLKQEVAILDAMKRKGVSLAQQAQELPVFLPLLKVGSMLTTGSGEGEESRMRFYGENSPMWSPCSSATSLTSLVMNNQQPQHQLLPGGMEDMYSSPYMSYRPGMGGMMSSRRHSSSQSAMRRSTSYGYNGRNGPFHFSRENSVQSLSGGIGAEGDEDQDARYMTRAHYSRNYPPSPLSRITSSSQTLRGVHTSQGIARSERRRSSQRGSRGMEVDSELRRSSGSRMASMENLEHRADASSTNSTEQMITTTTATTTPSVSVQCTSRDLSENNHVKAHRRSSSPGDKFAIPEEEEEVAMQNLNRPKDVRLKSLSNPHLLALSTNPAPGGGGGGAGRPLSPRPRGSNSRLMTTLEEQDEQAGGPPMRKSKQVQRAASLHSDDANESISKNMLPVAPSRLEEVPSWMCVGVAVRVGHPNKKGTVMYCGRTHFSEGTMVGVSLNSPHGRHDGSVDGVKYFQCLPNHGVFVKADRLEPISQDEMRNHSQK
ncbi:kinesin-like protein KIF13B [Symsagittifera roscoffensis]|uniref:kinesin-like protein KIF13B n=1 Tax=Symsagittifera roscoffensis TaxID=84072 RepID=UPI00307C1994